MEKNPRVAKTLSVLVFLFACVVSLAIVVTGDPLDAIDYALIGLSPPALAAIAYLVGLYHDPSAPD